MINDRRYLIEYVKFHHDGGTGSVHYPKERLWTWKERADWLIDNLKVAVLVEVSE